MNLTKSCQPNVSYKIDWQLKNCCFIGWTMVNVHMCTQKQRPERQQLSTPRLTFTKRSAGASMGPGHLSTVLMGWHPEGSRSQQRSKRTSELVAFNWVSLQIFRWFVIQLYHFLIWYWCFSPPKLCDFNIKILQVGVLFGSFRSKVILAKIGLEIWRFGMKKLPRGNAVWDRPSKIRQQYPPYGGLNPWLC